MRGGCRGGRELPSGWVFICSSTVGKLVREGSRQRGRPVFIRVELITKQTNRANPVSIRSMEFFVQSYQHQFDFLIAAAVSQAMRGMMRPPSFPVSAASVMAQYLTCRKNWIPFIFCGDFMVVRGKFSPAT